MVGDVREVVRMQPEVERVEDEAAARDAEVRLEVLMVVPAERRDAVAALEPERLEGDRELLRAARRLAPRRVVEAPVGKAGDDRVARRTCGSVSWKSIIRPSTIPPRRRAVRGDRGTRRRCAATACGRTDMSEKQAAPRISMEERPWSSMSFRKVATLS
jgi:hypothetical protein